jgi:hypothetical protein
MFNLVIETLISIVGWVVGFGVALLLPLFVFCAVAAVVRNIPRIVADFKSYWNQ